MLRGRRATCFARVLSCRVCVCVCVCVRALGQMFYNGAPETDPQKAALHEKIRAVALQQADNLVADGERRAAALEAQARARLGHNRHRSMEEVRGRVWCLVFGVWCLVFGVWMGAL